MKFLAATEMKFDESMTAALWQQMITIAVYTNKKFGGSVAGGAPTIDRDFSFGHRRIMLDYVWTETLEKDDGSEQKGPVYSAAIFERRFCKPKERFDRVFNAVLANSEYLRKVLSLDCTGKLGASLLVKMVAALRHLACGSANDNNDEYVV